MLWRCPSTPSDRQVAPNFGGQPWLDPEETWRRVARTGTHLFLFARYVEQFRGWGRGLRRAVGGWYTAKDVDDLAYQLVKYRQREGWSHRDLLRLSHPVTDEVPRQGLFDWAVGRDGAELPPLVDGFLQAQNVTTAAAWGPRLTRLGVARGRRQEIAAQITDAGRLRKARIHPVNILVAQRTYAGGRSARGESSWTPDRVIVDALDAAFYAAFGNVVPAGKRTLLALDVSGSMGAPIGNMPLTAREGSAAMALVTMATEPDTDVVGFAALGGSWYRSTGLAELSISPRQRLDDAIRSVANLPFGATDCSLPMVWAQNSRREYDTIVVYTDNETYAGRVHPHQALVEYRQNMGIQTRLIVVGMTSTGFSIADPGDPGMLDVVGFDSAAPQLISDFSRGF